MATLEIHTFPSPILSEKAKPVEKITDKILQLIHDMNETMHANNGIGLAAPQIGKSLRIAVLDVEEKKKPSPGCKTGGKFDLINPEIIETEGEIIYEEGCLSVPDFWQNMKRYETLTLKYLDKKGNKKTLKAEGLLAIAIQQELDHLEGKLIIDEVSSLKRGLYLQKIKKKKKKK